jgi:hypothetical protein
VISTERAATQIASALDDHAQIHRLVEHFRSGVGPPAVTSCAEFEAAYVELLGTRIVGANVANEYSEKFTGNFDGVRARSKSLFKMLVSFAEEQADLDVRKDLFLLLCYIKPESPVFVSRVVELQDRLGSNDPVSSSFVEYLLSLAGETSARFPKLTPIEHFRSTKTLSLAGEQLQCRIAHGGWASSLDVYCGCSTADSLVFDPTAHKAATYITLPGLSIGHVRHDMLMAIYDSIIAPLGSPPDGLVTVTVCVGFVDRLKIAGALHRWTEQSLNALLRRLIATATAAVRTANAIARGRFVFRLYPGSFAVGRLDRMTVNGVVPFHSGNAALSGAIGHILAETGQETATRRIEDERIPDAALIHDREIHPKLGLKAFL